MTFVDLVDLKFPDICLTGEENPETPPSKLNPTGELTRSRCVTCAHATACSSAVDCLKLKITKLNVENKLKNTLQASYVFSTLPLVAYFQTFTQQTTCEQSSINVCLTQNKHNREFTGKNGTPLSGCGQVSNQLDGFTLYMQTSQKSLAATNQSITCCSTMFSWAMAYT